MGADTIIAICATIIAVASLAVSIYEGRATRRHNRLSVRPFLRLATTFRTGDTAGLLLTNAGLGPAVITKTLLWLDGTLIGEFNEVNVNKVRETRPSSPPTTAATCCGSTAMSPTGTPSSSN